MRTSRFQDWWTLSSISISLFTTVLNVSNLIVQLPFTLNGQSSRVPFQHWTLTFLKVFPLMFLIITPRLLALSHFFAYCSNPDGILALLLSIIVHGFCYCSYLIYKNKSINDKLEEFLFLGFVSSMIAPCTIIDPRWYLFILSSISSAICISTLMFAMLSTLICSITLPGKAFTIFCIIIQVYTIMFSIILYKIIKSHNAINILHWTCEKGLDQDVKAIFQQNRKLLWKLDEHGHSALMIACIYGHEAIVKFLLNTNLPQARSLKITSKVVFNIASEASYVYILSVQKFIKNAKNGPIWRVFENLKLAVKQCYQTGQF